MGLEEGDENRGRLSVLLKYMEGFHGWGMFLILVASFVGLGLGGWRW